jgi:hypothetical protein
LIEEDTMANRVHAFRDRDIRRIVKSVEASTGRSAQRVEVDPNSGRVAVIVTDNIAVTGNSWDEVLPNAAHSKRPA